MGIWERRRDAKKAMAGGETWHQSGLESTLVLYSTVMRYPG